VAVDISHPNIAAPIGAGLEHGSAYLAQEYAVGESLDVVLRARGHMAMPDVTALVESLARAIDHAAGRGVRHGLLHPRDIVLADDTVRITGFGIAAALSNIGAKLPTRPQYVSPDKASDVHSLGAIAFEAATGKRVSADNMDELEAEHGTRLRSAFAGPLAASPELRPARAADFAAALRAAAGTTSEPDFDLRLEPPTDLMGTADEDLTDNVVMSEPPALTVSAPSWSPPPTSTLYAGDAEPEPSSRRWPIVVTFLAFAVLAALSVGFFLRSPRPVPAAEKPGVDSTIVDLPASAPSSPNAAAGKPNAGSSPNATAGNPNARSLPNATASKPNVPSSPNATAGKPARGAPSAPAARRSTPSPTPSRPASGAVARAQTGSVLIRSTPADADVVVDGKLRGKTPLALRDLELGSYTIRVARDGYAAEERTVQLTVQRPSTSTTIDLRPAFAAGAAAAGKPTSAGGASPDGSAGTPGQTGPGGINVLSRPEGARVFVDNRLAGSTPIAIPGLPAGPATVRIELDGYQPWTTVVRVSAGEQTRVAASLERR
jgi:hypothetical protein